MESLTPPKKRPPGQLFAVPADRMSVLNWEELLHLDEFHLEDQCRAARHSGATAVAVGQV